MVNWDFVVLFGTIMFWALLHIWSPDGRQWRTDRAERGKSSADTHSTADTPSTFDAEVASAPRSRRS